MTNTEIYVGLVRQFTNLYDQKCYRFTSDVPTATLNLRGDLIDEELKEYNAARKANNKLLMLDGLCDLAYVVAGTIVTCGLMPIPFTNTKSNDDYILDPQANFIIDECYCPVPCHRRMYRYANECLARIETIGTKFRLPEAFKVVHENNMDKLWSARPEDKDLIVVPKNGKFLVRNKAGKVLKPPTHKAPNLSIFL